MVIINKKQKDIENDPKENQKEQENLGFGAQDDYQAKGFELVQWTQNNKGIVIIAIISLLLVTIGMSTYSYYMKRINEEASSAYLEAIKENLDEDQEDKELSKDELEKRIEALKSVMQKYRNSSVAPLIALDTGALCLQENKFVDALSYYEEAMKKINEKDTLYPVAIFGLAKSLEMNENKQEAINYLEKIINADKLFPGRDKALFEAARLVKNIDKERAKKYITILLEDYPESNFVKKAKNFQLALE